ncbi:unnamed protein product, partial [Penicillium nalgiovense]
AYPARIVVDADLSCEAPSYIAGLVAATAVVMEALKPVGTRGHHDTSECEDASPDFFGLGIRLLLYFFGYVSTKEPVAQMVARITVSLLALKTFEQC